ncbi:CYP714A1 [Symbiodinium pilosum]|uniref:CYP714A1 protein n=1 Tax=Symbiodinium pilosum TaxID=2952 RepID=A0A812T9B3_SYMPI|nr:CYP714A1 [Symbiodinium pilosum]
MTLHEVLMMQPPYSKRTGLDKALDKAEAKGSLAALSLLPGPWAEAQTREDKLRLLELDWMANQEGIQLQLYAAYQERYGDKGLGSNIAVPTVVMHSKVTEKVSPDKEPSPWDSAIVQRVMARVILADPADAERVARIHVRKEPNFGVLMDSVISTTDNEHWREQRQHLVEAFLPLSSLAKILPVSLARAKECANRLGKMAEDGPVDMSDFLLHEAQAQLQLALLGAPESLMEETNAGIRKTFMFHPEAKLGVLSNAMKEIMKVAQEDQTLGLPSDGCPVRGPLSRALQTGKFHASTDYGNLLLILFAGHDTTGHTMTWLTFELARNPDIQKKVQEEVDQFFRCLNGRDPTYQDLSRFDVLDKCITETLRLWPAVANGTFRQLQFSEELSGQGGKQVTLPKGTLVTISNWCRHRNPDLWGQDADNFNPWRNFATEEMARVGCPMAAMTPQSARFSPFAHNPRSCLGKNFAQMEMRLILSYLFHKFEFALAPPYDALADTTIKASDTNPKNFRGINSGGTMGPMDLEHGGAVSDNERYLAACSEILGDKLGSEPESLRRAFTEKGVQPGMSNLIQTCLKRKRPAWMFQTVFCESCRFANLKIGMLRTDTLYESCEGEFVSHRGDQAGLHGSQVGASACVQTFATACVCS